MRDLERQIEEWRKQMIAGGVKSPAPLEELESHLREEIRCLISKGMAEPEAFETAASRLGNPASVRSEFDKIGYTRIWPVKIGSLLWLGAVLMQATILYRLFRQGIHGQALLFCSHFFGTAGYLAAFLAGGFGICYVCYRLFRTLTPDNQQSLSRAVHLFSGIAAASVLTSVILGTVWTHQNFRVWGLGDSRWACSICASVWLITMLLVQRFSETSDHVKMLLVIGGNIVVCLAWSGAVFISYAFRSHGIGYTGYWPLGVTVFVATHIFFIALGAIGNRETVKS